MDKRTGSDEDLERRNEEHEELLAYRRNRKSNGNGTLGMWKMACTFLAGIVLSLSITWFTQVKNAASQADLEKKSEILMAVDNKLADRATVMDDRFNKMEVVVMRNTEFIDLLRRSGIGVVLLTDTKLKDDLAKPKR